MSVLRPLGHRVLVKPDPAETETASGIVMPENRDVLPVSGTVVEMGPGGHRGRYQARQRAIDACLAAYLATHPDHASERVVMAALQALQGTGDPVRELQVGDRVIFPVEVGFAVTYDGEPYVLVDEDDLAVVVAEEVPHAA